MNIFGLKLLVCLAAFAIGDEDPNAVSVFSGLSESTEKAGQLQQQMRMLQVSAMDPNSTMQSDSLKSLIGQIQTLKLPMEIAQPAKPAADQKSSPAPIAVVQPPSQSVPKKADPNVSPLAEIDAVKEPLNALAAADAMYRMGDYVRAMRFYDMVAAQKSEANIVPRQWAMYQAANCMRRQNPDQAMELYGKLLAEYPNNVWASAALAQKHTLEWLKKNETELKQRIQIDDPNS